jgi:ASC-1-like (ASCH) protein
MKCMKTSFEHRAKIRPRLQNLMGNEPEWAARVADAPQIHLAVLVEPYLEYLFAGKKTIESRFSIHRIAPFEEVLEGDVVLLKRSGGPVVGVALVGQTEFFHLAPNTWARVKSYSRQICADVEFWHSRRDKRYATLLHIADIIPLEPFEVEKSDRRAWVVLDNLGSLP